MSNHTRLRVENYPGFRAFFGHRDDLIAAGIVKASWLPGQPGRNRTCQGIVFNGGKPEFAFGKGSPLKYKANGRRWMRIYRKSIDGFRVERPYREDEQYLRAKANEEPSAAHWKPSIDDPYVRELELCSPTKRPADYFMARAFDAAKFEHEVEASRLLHRQIESESGDKVDSALLVFAVIRYAEIITRLKAGSNDDDDDDDDDDDGGRPTPAPTPTPHVSA